MARLILGKLICHKTETASEFGDNCRLDIQVDGSSTKQPITVRSRTWDVDTAVHFRQSAVVDLIEVSRNHSLGRLKVTADRSGQSAARPRPSGSDLEKGKSHFGTLQPQIRNEFAIIEMGPSTADSLAFRTGMLDKKLELYGVDRTPVLEPIDKYPVKKKGMSYLSKLPSSVLQNDGYRKALSRWLVSLLQGTPVFLFLSGHHTAGSMPVLYSDYRPDKEALAAEFHKSGRVTLGYKTEGTIFGDMIVHTRHVPNVQASNSSFGNRLIAVIVDGCNICNPNVSNAAVDFQTCFAGKLGPAGATGWASHKFGWHGAHYSLQYRVLALPVVLSFGTRDSNARAPKDTGVLHERFVKALPRKRDLFKALNRNPDQLVDLWLKAAEKWRYRQRVAALDTTGRLLDYRGQPM